MGEKDRALADFTEAIRLDPKKAGPYNDRGNVYDEKGDRTRALADYAEAIRLNPNDPLPFNNRGMVYAAQNDYDHAIADFNEAIRVDPKEKMAFFNRGLFYAEQKDRDHAIADFSEVIKLDPKMNSAFYNRGIAFAPRAIWTAPSPISPKRSSSIRSRRNIGTPAASPIASSATTSMPLPISARSCGSNRTGPQASTTAALAIV